MPDWLSPEERFSDHVEITGYLTVAVSAVFLVLYFGMIFFYRPVQLQGAGTNLLLLLAAAAFLTLGFFIPRHHNPGRWLLRFLFLIAALFAYFQAQNGRLWLYGPLLVFSLYGRWVLGHPVAVGFFRSLQPYEQRSLPMAGWFTFHRVVLGWYAWLTLWEALLLLSRSEHDQLSSLDQGVFQIFLSLLLLFLLLFLRRLHGWARWCLALLCLGLGLAAVPDTMDPVVDNYPAYWQTLAKVFYFLGLSGYLLFSRNLRRAFRP